MKSRKGFTLIELMVVVLIVGILAAVAIPLMRGRIDAAKWSEGKAIMGTIATSLRAYIAEKGSAADGTSPTMAQLGFAAGDLDGTYFIGGDSGVGDFTWVITTATPIVYSITAASSKAGGPTTPASIKLDQTGTWTEL